jgi:hypothetical protein
VVGSIHRGLVDESCFREGGVFTVGSCMSSLI